MGQFHDTVELMKHYRPPTVGELKSGVTRWWQSESKWYAVSVGGHGLLLLLIAFLPAAVPELAKQEAPAFEAKVDTAIPEQDFTQFEMGDPPIEPTELSTETLTIMEPIAVEAQQEEFNDESPVFEHRGGGSSSDANATALGGLGGFNVDAIGAGPAVRGGGGVGAAFGTGGAGSGGTGTGFGGRGKGMREAALASGGGTKQTEKSVQGGLVWLARHQNPDGSWSIHQHQCRDGRCTCGGEGDTKSDTAATAFGLLPYLAAGQTHLTDGPFKQTIFGGLDWMIRNQDQKTGNLSVKSAQVMYSHGLAAIVMCEAFALSKDPRVGRAAQGGINFIESGQDPETGGWWYNHGQKGGDTSVFGWQLMALKSGQMAGLSVKPTTLSGAQKWLKSVAKGQKGGLFCYRPDSGPAQTMTAVGILSTQYLGAQRNDPRIVEGMNYFMANMPQIGVRNCYYWYYATQVMHNLPGPEWDRWNREMRRILIDTQVKEGCAAGSWDPNLPRPDAWARQGGRVMVTSIAALTLEVYYRYLPLYQLDPTDTMGAPK